MCVCVCVFDLCARFVYARVVLISPYVRVGRQFVRGGGGVFMGSNVLGFSMQVVLLVKYDVILRSYNFTTHDPV